VAYAALGERDYLDAAEAAAATTLAYGDVRRNPSACHGLAGSAEVFLALYRATHEPRWLSHAYDFGRQMLAYRTTGPEGDAWQADDPGFTSPDFFCGAAGVGHYFLRLGTPDSLHLPFV
jgi:lantibiotic modifying enzyme